MSQKGSSRFLKELGINITIEEIADSYSKEKNRSSSLIRPLQSVYDQQIAVEDRILRDERWCPPMPNHSPLLINFEQIQKYISKKNSRMMHARALEVLSCVANNIISLDAPAARSHTSLFRKFLTNVRLIGAPSERGYAMVADLADKVDDAFVIKVQRDAEQGSNFSRYTMRHEVIVGLILNQLRAIIPNFAYVFGSFECGSPILTVRDSSFSVESDAVKAVDPKRSMEPRIESWCRGGEIQTYAIYENIRGAISLKEYVKNCTSQQYMDIIIQIMYALKIAYERVGFTHYDLHNDNVMVRNYDRDAFYIPYEGDYVFASKIATIIDFGMSHVNYTIPETGRVISLGIKEPDGARGNAGVLQYGIYMDRPNPIIDCYKILWWTLYTMLEHNKKVYMEMRELMRYFHKTDSFDSIFVNYPEHIYGIVPTFGTKILTEQSSKFSYNEFIRFCREYCDYKGLDDPVVRAEDLPPEAKADVLVCRMACFTNPVFTEDSSTAIIDTAEEMNDLFEPIMIRAADIRYKIKSASDSHKKKLQTMLDDLTESFLKLKKQYGPKLDGILKRFVTSINDQIAGLKPIEYIRIPERNPMTIFEPEIFMMLNTQLRIVSTHLDTMDSIKNNIEIVDNLKWIFDIESGYEPNISMFKAKDSREKLKGYVNNDLVLLKRTFRDFDLDKFTGLGELLLHGYSNLFY